MNRKRILLKVNSLGTDRAGETLHYEVDAGDQRIIGDFVGKLSTGPYLRLIGEVPNDVTATLATPDARLELIEEPVD
jgi:hypothetical protein